MVVCYSQQWILDKQDLVRERQLDLQILSEEEYQKICIFFSNCKLKLKLYIIKPIFYCLINPCNVKYLLDYLLFIIIIYYNH